MNMIYKYELQIDDMQVIEMPKGSEILTAQVQNNKVCLWAMVDPVTSKTEGRKIRMIGTGNPVEDSNLKYISTVQMVNGLVVWHIFEVLS